MMIAPA